MKCFNAYKNVAIAEDENDIEQFRFAVGKLYFGLNGNNTQLLTKPVFVTDKNGFSFLSSSIYGLKASPDVKSITVESPTNNRNYFFVTRFFSIDPLASKYPWYSSYQFAGNTPIWARELEGLEPNYSNKFENEDGSVIGEQFVSGSDHTRQPIDPNGKILNAGEPSSTEANFYFNIDFGLGGSSEFEIGGSKVGVSGNLISYRLVENGTLPEKNTYTQGFEAGLGLFAVSMSQEVKASTSEVTIPNADPEAPASAGITKKVDNVEKTRNMEFSIGPPVVSMTFGAEIEEQKRNGELVQEPTKSTYVKQNYGIKFGLIIQMESGVEFIEKGKSW